MSRTEGMYLILGTTPETNWHTVSVLFEHAGWVVSAENSEACYQNGEAHTKEDVRFLLLHSHPEEAIAHTIANGASPEQAREAWLTAAKAMVNFYKRHRQQAVMVYITNLLADPKAQLTIIAGQLGLTDHALPTFAAQVEQAPLLERLMASQLLQQTPGITALLAQIEACTLPLTGHSYSAPALDFNAANSQLVRLRANQAESEQLAMRLQQEESQHLDAKQKAETAYKAELNQMLENLRRVNDANRKLEEELAGQLQQQAAELARQKEQQAELRSQLAGVTLQSQQSHEESSLLLEQLHLVQEELEAKFISHNQLQEQLVQFEAQRKIDQQAKQKAEKTLQQTEHKRKEVEAEYKEDLNQTLAKLRSANDANRKLKEELAGQLQQQAAELTRQKEQQAEKTLEETEQKRREVEADYKKDLNKTLAKLCSAEETNRKLDSELAEYRDQQDHALEAANHQIQRLQKELNSFRSSIAFKATLPVRAIKARLRGNRERKALKKPAKLVRQSGLFNEGWYLKTYPDVAENGIDPIFHYLKFGAEERRNPSPEFDTDWYLISYPDVAEAGLNPLIHYLKFGQQEGRSTSRQNHPSLPTLRAA